MKNGILCIEIDPTWLLLRRHDTQTDIEYPVDFAFYNLRQDKIHLTLYADSISADQ